ncbi:Uncharacterised protein [Salmonella enterica subsp. salamae]|nr:hypothetical protein [Salmonella enterica subsp. salamae serovar Greenside]EDV4563283.1 hypothetical protein [Salmonella enterica subsp. enterica]EKT7570202.1 hypothetical protein [Salmonella enterica]VEA58784.1 Uncharacterised protein [Salmonella enterica subsp. salamae]EKT7778799.1 hypothetical protein [Salmonella enterica]
MNEYNILNQIEWHDGVFLDSQLSCKNGSVNLMVSVSVYNDNKRNELNVEFISVENLTMTMDAIELNDNRNAGNISNGYVKKVNNKPKYKFFLYFTDGYLNLTFKNIRVMYK